MPRRTLSAVLGAGALVLAGLTAGMTSAAAAPSEQGQAHGLHPVRTCHAVLARGEADCHALVMADSSGKPMARPKPSSPALSAQDVQSAYHLGSLKSGGRTVAIVDAYGYPNLERDLGTYRAYMGLPGCTTADGCLRIVNQAGDPTSLPAFDLGWAQEQALDVDAVSAACPDCHILVVQANSNGFDDLGAAVNEAASQPGVVAISNSYGGGDAPDSTYAKYYQHPGIAVTASTGDNGYKGASYPASSSYVTAVGGTSLVKASTSRGWSETVWSGTGSGCSSYNTALSAASSFDTGCAGRAMADVAAAADPSNGGLNVYYPTDIANSAWGQFGGTSEASPIIAAVYALSGNTSGYANAIPYGNPGSLFDVTSGSNGRCGRTTPQWCTARTGWDGPTGLGTPNGAGAF